MSEPEGQLTDSIAQIWGVILRGRWWIITSACLIPLAAIVVLFRLPDRYTSDATLLIVQQQIPQRYVDQTNTSNSSDLLETIRREVLSRSRLLGVIDSLGLYPKERKTLTPDRLAELMRKEVVVEPLDQLPGRLEFTAFQISFSAETPQLAQKVAARLTSLFIEENLKSREKQATTTTKFLTEQLQAAKERLDQQEERLRAFKLKNSGGASVQDQGNLEMLTGLRVQLQNNLASKNKAQLQHSSLETTLNSTLARYQADRSQLITRYTAKHPEVLRKDSEIEYLKDLLSRLKTGSSGIEKPQGFLASQDPIIAQLKSQVETNLADLELFTKEEQKIRSEIPKYQGGVRLNPMREEELANIMRDYDLYNQDYKNLLNQQLKSQVTADMEEQQGGQHFRLVEPPTLPIKPSGPKRLKIGLGALAAGFVVGISLAYLLELWKGALYTEKEVQQQFKAPLVIGIPLFYTRAEERWHKWRTAFEWVGGSLMFAVTLAAEFYVFIHG